MGTKEQARQVLIDRHMPLVRSVARRYAGRGEELDDLVQAGAVALVRAYDRFDPDRGVTFATFVTPAIEGEIRRHLLDRTPAVRIPRELARMSRRVRRRQGELAAKLGRYPTTEELAAALDADLPEIERALAAQRAADPVKQSADDGALEEANPVHPLSDSDDRMLLAGGLRALDDRERRIVFLRFHADMTEREIGRAVGISQAHVSRLLDGALSKLRAELDGNDADITPEAVVSPGPVPKSPESPANGKDATPRARAGGQADSRIAAVAADQEGQATRPSKQKTHSTYSGRFLVRLPSELHEQLARAAERQDVSLNRYVTDALATSLTSPSASEAAAPETSASDPAASEAAASPRASKTNGSPPAAETAEPPLSNEPESASDSKDHTPPPSPGVLRVALATNLAVVVLAGVVAVVLLVLALQRGI
jgi:RNA polymerase sigma-B factor